MIENLLNLIPHRGKMVMLSRITEFDIGRRSLVSEFDTGPSCIFYDEALRGIPAWAGFECMAQSVSALSGILDREKNLPPKLGVILSVSRLEITLPVLSGTITVHVCEECCIDSIFTFSCTVSCGAEPALEAKLTVMAVNNIEDLAGERNG